MEYVPFGEVFIEERNHTWNTPYLFNGKELDEETGLYYYGARYYNPRVSQWLSVDPLAEKYPSHSPYNYTLNNPVKFVDLDGEDIFITDGTNTYRYINGQLQAQGENGWKNISGKELSNVSGFVRKTVDHLNTLSAKSTTGKNLINFFAQGNNDVTLTSGRKTSVTRNEMTINYNARSNQRISNLIQDPSVFSPDWVSIGHEFGHLYSNAKGWDMNIIEYFNAHDDWQWNASLDLATDEIFATHIENNIRSEAGLPLRLYYSEYFGSPLESTRVASDNGISIFYDLNGNFNPNGSYTDLNGKSQPNILPMFNYNIKQPVNLESNE